MDQGEKSDIAEFMERTAHPMSAADTGPGRRGSFGAQPSQPERAQAGKPVQWALNGDGFTPATETRQALDPGVYGIEIRNELLTFAPKKVVTDKLLRLPDSKSDMVISEIEDFWERAPLFARYGFSHKRGFLLWGDQGSGKTSTVKFVMREVVARGGVAVVVGDAQPGMVARGLQLLRDVEPDRHVVVVMEDVDALVSRHGEQEILSILDGESSIAGVVFIATTNYPENLAARFTNRPARFDRVVKVGMPDDAARRLYVESRETGLSAAEIGRWVEQTEGFSIAHLRELIVAVLCLGRSLEETVDRLRGMSRAPKSDAPETAVGFGAGR